MGGSGKPGAADCISIFGKWCTATMMRNSEVISHPRANRKEAKLIAIARARERESKVVELSKSKMRVKF